MSTTRRTHAPAPAGEQGSHHWLLTLELPGRAALTQDGTWTPPAGMTRQDAYLAIRRSIAGEHPEMAHANTVFFSIEPNRL
ncbi:hypothetical protein [Streptomyces sp. NPDC054952]